MERVFNNSATGIFDQALRDNDDGPEYYHAMVRALIVDAVDFEESELRPEREENTRYYNGEEPSLSATAQDEYNSLNGDPEVVDSTESQSTIVSTDVRDTVLAIMPSLMRIFAGSEHAVTFEANNAESAEMAAQATDYIRYKLWQDNDGFLTLHNVFKDTLTVKLGIITWYTYETHEVSEQVFKGITEDQLAMIVNEDPSKQAQAGEFSVGPDGLIPEVAISYLKSSPRTIVEPVAPENFRISRNAKTVKTADLVGREEILRVSDLVEMGYDYDEVIEYRGAVMDYAYERQMRNPGADFGQVTNDYVQYGEYFIRIDADGDGINELRKICTIGPNYDILDDYMTDEPNYALFSADPTPHTVVGDSPADLSKDIQRINTNLIRGGLNSLSQSIYPRTVINELLTNVDDALSDDIGAVIRTRGDTQTAVHSLVTPWVGRDVFEMKAQMDLMRQSRTGISEASKGLDPKAMQSTNVMGIDAIVTGAQERIELIARILAETGMKDLYRGLLREYSRYPNKAETIQLRGKWVEVNPSLFDPSMRCVVNPALGKGSDQSRLMALQQVKDTQLMVIGKFGINNPMVTVQEFRNTIVDMLELVNIRNVSRYFKEVTPEIEQAIKNTPKEPDPATVLAQAELEKVKKDVLVAQGELAQKDRKLQMDDDFRRDELNVTAFLEIAGIFEDLAIADAATESEVEPMNEAP